MNKKCLGCGVLLQDNNSLIEGYTTSLNNDYCMRCFKMINYGEYEFVTKANEEYIKLLQKIGKKKDLVLLVVDVLNIPCNLTEVTKYFLNNKIILVINKKDTLPLSIKEEKIIDYFKKDITSFCDIVFVSGLKNYNLDNLMFSINKYKTSDNIYVVGNTNAGKSTLINKLIKDYSIDTPKITISPMPSTTLDEITIKLSSFNLIDTPGLVDDGNILNYVDTKVIKKISCKKEIKPRTYQIKENQSLILDNIIRIDYHEKDRNSFTFFISNDLDIKKLNSKNNNLLHELPFENIIVRAGKDLVIDGLGFIKIRDNCHISIYKNSKIKVFTRDNLI